MTADTAREIAQLREEVQQLRFECHTARAVARSILGYVEGMRPDWEATFPWLKSECHSEAPSIEELLNRVSRLEMAIGKNAIGSGKMTIDGRLRQMAEEFFIRVTALEKELEKRVCHIEQHRGWLLRLEQQLARILPDNQ